MSIQVLLAQAPHYAPCRTSHRCHFYFHLWSQWQKHTWIWTLQQRARCWSWEMCTWRCLACSLPSLSWRRVCLHQPTYPSLFPRRPFHLSHHQLTPEWYCSLIMEKIFSLLSSESGTCSCTWTWHRERDPRSLKDACWRSLHCPLCSAPLGRCRRSAEEYLCRLLLLLRISFKLVQYTTSYPKNIN